MNEDIQEATKLPDDEVIRQAKSGRLIPLPKSPVGSVYALIIITEPTIY